MRGNWLPQNVRKQMNHVHADCQVQISKISNTRIARKRHKSNVKWMRVIQLTSCTAIPDKHTTQLGRGCSRMLCTVRSGALCALCLKESDRQTQEDQNKDTTQRELSRYKQQRPKKGWWLLFLTLSLQLTDELIELIENSVNVVVVVVIIVVAACCRHLMITL